MLRVYGKVGIPSKRCKICEADYFVVKGTETCCGESNDEPLDIKTFKIEVPFPDKMKRPGKSKRLKILKRDGYKCTYCRIGLTELDVYPVVDHFYPVSAGGSNREENLKAACQKCNLRKGGRIFETTTHVREVVVDLKGEIEEGVQE